MVTAICLQAKKGFSKMAFSMHRLTPTSQQQPSMESIKLDATNVLAVLQRAEHHKSEAVVNDCVRFLRVNLQPMVAATASSAELADLSDDVIRKLAGGCHHGDVEALRDKSDRIRSRLFRHLTERLLEADAKPELGSPESAANVFRCSVCSRLLHQRTASKVTCHAGNFSIDKYGGLIPKHVRNEQWSAKLYVKALFFRRKSWRHVYWKLWSDVHYLECVKCSTNFPCNQMGCCAYHPLAAKFAAETGGRNANTPIGQFPCCRRPACRFDPWEMNDKGCRYRDHVVNPLNPISLSVHREFVCHREIIYASNNESSACEKSRFIAACSEATVCPEIEPVVDDVLPKKALDALVKSDGPVRESRRRPRSVTGSEPSDGLRICCGDDGSSTSSSSSQSEDRRTSEDISIGSSSNSSSSSDDDDEESSNSASIDSLTKSGACKSRKTTPAVLWDASRSRRYNHDVLRDYEQRKFREMMIDELMVGRVHRRLADSESSTLPILNVRPIRLQHQQKREQVLGHPAGIYGRLEGEWRAARATSAAATEAGTSTFRPRMASVLAVAKFKQTKKS